MVVPDSTFSYFECDDVVVRASRARPSVRVSCDPGRDGGFDDVRGDGGAFVVGVDRGAAVVSCAVSCAKR